MPHHMMWQSSRGQQQGTTDQIVFSCTQLVLYSFQRLFLFIPVHFSFLFWDLQTLSTMKCIEDFFRIPMRFIAFKVCESQDMMEK